MAKLIYLTIILITINFSIQCGGKGKDVLFTNDNPNANVTQSDINEASNFGFPNKFNGTYNACECKYDLSKKNITVTYELYYKETKSYSLIICSFNYNNILNSNSLSSLQSCGDNYSFEYTYNSSNVYQYFFSFQYVYIQNILPPIVINTPKPAPIVIVQEGAKIQDVVIEPKEKEIVTVIDNSKNTIYVNKTSSQPSSVIYNPRTPDKITITPGSGSGSVSSVNNTNSTSTGNCNGNNGSGSTSGIVVIPTPTPTPVVPAKQIIIIEERWEKKTLVVTTKKTTISGNLYVDLLVNFLFKTKYSCLIKANLNKNFKVTCGIGKNGFKQASSPKLACEGGSDYFVACPCAAA